MKTPYEQILEEVLKDVDTDIQDIMYVRRYGDVDNLEGHHYVKDALNVILNWQTVRNSKRVTSEKT